MAMADWEAEQSLQLAVSMLLVVTALLLWVISQLKQKIDVLTSQLQVTAGTAGAFDVLGVQPGPPHVFSWATITEAPTPSMDMNTVAEGEAMSFRDGRGAIYRFKLGPDTFVNMYHTKAGYRRSGDLHDCTQYDVVLKGRTRLRMLDANTGREVVREYGDNEFIAIPPRTPHMFEFLEDNYLLEWWGDEFRAWYYQPYRDIINKGLQLSAQATAGMDFSIDPVEQALAQQAPAPQRLYHTARCSPAAATT